MKYDPNSRLMRFFTKIADLMILNLTFVISCLPVFTVGASWTALYYVALKMVKDRQSGIIKAFIASFKENFKQATLLWLGILALGALLLFDIRVVDGLEESAMTRAVRIIALLILLLLFMLLQYLFPLLARFKCTDKEALKNAALMVVGSFPKTVLMCAFGVLPVMLTLLNEYTMLSGFFAWLSFAFALIAAANSCLLVKIFEKYVPGSGEKEDEPETDN